MAIAHLPPAPVSLPFSIPTMYALESAGREPSGKGFLLMSGIAATKGPGKTGPVVEEDGLERFVGGSGHYKFPRDKTASN